MDPLQGYIPPFRNKQPAANAEKAKEEQKPRITYTIEFIFSLKNANKQRPENMAELNFPHKKRGTNGFRKKPLTEKDKFNKTLGELRILLNKLSMSNFDVISQKLLAFQYNPSLLYELMKMIFIKSTGEHSYLDVYVRLCTLLFRQFADKEHYEMNFKKLLVSKCQKQFFKMLNKEREERKKRRDSMTAANDEMLKENGEPKKEETPKEGEDDDGGFSKPMMYLFDDNELQERKREQMYGNMYLITELYVAKQLNGNIIKTCLDDLFQEINDQNIEILSYMINKLMIDLVKTARVEMKNGSLHSNAKFNKKSNKSINLEYADQICQKLFSYRQDDRLQSRIKFKVQDIIDSYNKEWRYTIADAKSRISDSEGFNKIYVPKDRILTEEQVYGSARKTSFHADKKEGTTKYFYREKEASTSARREVEEPVVAKPVKDAPK